MSDLPETSMAEETAAPRLRRAAPRGEPPRRYRALVGLNYPTDAAAIRRILAGEDVPLSERHEHHAEPGEIVTNLPEHSIPSLLAKGRIEEVTD